MKRHKILHIDDSLVDNAVTLWRTGGLVAIPTETVYGLGADATNGEAVARIYHVKSRPQFNPLIIHVADARAACRYVEWNDIADVLADAFWPGPLTMVLKRRPRSRISDLVSAGGDTLAVRAPSHAIAQQLLQAFNGAIAAPSANRSGRVSPTTAAHVRAELGDDVPLIIDGGACEVGLESTVLDVSGEQPIILRSGSVTRDMIEEVLGEKIADYHSPLTTHHSPIKSPGQLESHYAPSIPVRLNASDVAEDEALLAFGPTPLVGAAKTLNLSPSSDLIEAAANLFAYLRALDDTSWRGIAVMPIPHEGIGVAINDRLQRAGAPR
jgi:L-threonylcarbamoyladenylate synthase